MLDVAEDGVVESALAAAVQWHARVEVAGRAPGLELRQERRRDRRVRPRAAARQRKAVEPILDEEARRRADRVRRCEENEVAVVEAAGGELGAEHLDGVAHVRQHVGVADVGRQPVAPPRRHLERRPVCHGYGVACGESDDVGAGDDPGALLLELRLGGVDHVQAAEALVLVVVHLGAVARDQHRRVASSDEAVVELEADEGGEDGGVRGGGFLDGGGDHVLGAGAGVGVEPHLELTVRGAEEQQERHC